MGSTFFSFWKGGGLRFLPSLRMFRIAAFFVLVFHQIDCMKGAKDEDEPEHLHDPPFLKYIPHLWPGGGECGDRTEPGIFYDGNDLAWRNGVVTAGECAKQCADEPQCHGWSHFAPAKRCYIKSSLKGRMIEFPGTESGPKPCGKTSASSQKGTVVELKPVTAILHSTWDGSYLHAAKYCIDGNTKSGRVCASNVENAPWLAIDYGTKVDIERVEIFNRVKWGDRSRNIDVRISDELPTSGSKMFSGGALLGHFDGPATDGEHIIISGKTMLSGRYVIVQLNQKTILNFQEVKAFGTSANGETADKATECWDKESDPLGEKYDGSVSTTVSGITCQAWASEQPHKPNYNIKGVSKLPENHCRNPDKHGGGPWCYTTDNKKRWEVCPVPSCATAATDKATERCIVEKDTNYAGNDIHFMMNGELMDNGVMGVEGLACAKLCLKTDGCSFWTTARGSHCFLKSSDSGRRSQGNFESGNKACAHEKYI